MCLFLQNTNFQRQTAALLTDMHAGSTLANATLQHISAGLQQQQHSMEELHAAQLAVGYEVKQQGKGMTQLQAQQSQLQGAVNQSLEVQVGGAMLLGALAGWCSSTCGWLISRLGLWRSEWHMCSSPNMQHANAPINLNINACTVNHPGAAAAGAGRL